MKLMPWSILLGLLCTLAAGAMARSVEDIHSGPQSDSEWVAEDRQIEPAGPVINEFMAANGSRTPLGEGDVLDADGDSSDWIELYNPMQQAVNLGGWYLTDDPGELTRWRFPAGTSIPANGYLLVFASGKNRTSGQLHTNFRLSADGGYLALVMSDGRTVAHEYAPGYPPQLTNISYGLAQLSAQFVTAGSTVSYHVPGPEDAGWNWTACGL